MHRRTVRQWLRTGEPPPRTKPKRRACELERHADYLACRWAEGFRNATQLGRELRARGIAGSARSVRHWIRQHLRSGKRPTAGPGTSAALFPSPRQIAWVLLDGPKTVEETTRALVEQLEGQVNRLKMLKRQMHGRASFSLLRSRVLFEQNRAPTLAPTAS